MRILIIIIILVLPSYATASSYTCELKGNVKKIDPLYDLLAKSTGGAVYNIDSNELRNVSEVSSFIGGFSRNSEGVEEEKVDLINAEFNIHGWKDYVFPVDSTLTKLAIAIKSNDPIKIVVKDSNKIQLNNKIDNVKVISFSTGCIILVDNPAIGNWNLFLSSNNRAKVETIIQGRSSIRFYRFDYQRTVFGREGFMRIKDEKVCANSYKNFRTTIFGKKHYKDIEYFEFKNKELKTTQIIKDIEDYIPGDKISNKRILVPSENTFIYAFGKDIYDNEFIRMHPYPVNEIESLSNCIKMRVMSD